LAIDQDLEQKMMRLLMEINVVMISPSRIHLWSRSFMDIATLRKKGTKAVTVAVPFQKVHFCT